nr:carbohydrate binding family 9 domain-containing protein [Burkholderiaceae bacterium]
MTYRSLLAAGLLSLALGVAAQPSAPAEAAPIQARQLPAGTRLVLDGSLSHPAWQTAPVHDHFIEKWPETGATPRHGTRVRVLFDDQALWVGVQALDSAPDQIRAPLVRYDGVNRTQDFVVVYIDAIGLRQSAQFFRVNAAGSLSDGMHTAADDSEDFSPDFDFDAATSRQPQGWTAVLRIPFASLRFAEPAAGAASSAQPWRILVGRRVPREQFYMHTSALVPREASSFIDTLQPLQGVRLPEQHQFLTLRPSLTWRTQRSRDGAGPRQTDNAWDASLDLKWRPLAELVVDATLNPDFSQVAVDEPQLAGNTRFALFFPEKRPFFFESSDLLRSPTEALYTRSLTAPRWGLRSTWRGGRLAGTAMAIDDRGGGLVLLPGAYGTGAVEQPASRTLLARAQLADGPMQWGALAALRRYEDAGRNQVAGPDLGWQIGGGWRARLQWLQSETSAQPDAAGTGLTEGATRRGHLAHARLLYQGDDRREADATLEDVGAGFRDDTGFIAQAGVRRAKGRVATGWGNWGPFNEFWLNLEGERVTDRATGAVVLQDLAPGIWLTGAHNLEAWAYLHGLVRGTAAMRPDAGRPLQQQRYLAAGLTVTPALWAPLLNAELKLGRLADVAGDVPRPGGQVQVSLTTRPLPRLELEPRLGHGWLRLGGRALYAESAHQLLARWHFSATQSLRAIVRYTATERNGATLDQATTGSLTWAWRESAGTVLY